MLKRIVIQLYILYCNLSRARCQQQKSQNRSKSAENLSTPPALAHIARFFLVLREKVCDIVTASKVSQPLRKNASGASHQADNLVKLRHEHLSVYGLIAKIFCAVSNEISLMWLSAVRGTRIDVATQRAERATPSRQSAELWHEHLSVYGLIAKIFCAVSNAISQVWLTLLRQTRNIVATTMTFA